MAAYDEFAWFYNRYWSQEFHELAFPILERLWLKHLPEQARLLDVCCGTGRLASMLVERGYRVTGIDGSAAMVEYARENAPQAHFGVADAAGFCVPAEFEGAVSTFDSVNHILTAADLASMFRSVAAALVPGGRLIFDALDEPAYQTRWTDSFSLVRDDHVLTLSGEGYDFRTRLARCEITMFRLLGGSWQRFDTVVHERCHTAEELEAGLRSAGFDEICVHPADQQGMGGQLAVGRQFWTAVKR